MWTPWFQRKLASSGTVAPGRYRVAAAAGQGQPKGTVAGQGCVDRTHGVAISHHGRHIQLPTENLLHEGVAGRHEADIRVCIKDGTDVGVEIDGDVATRHLAREGDVASGIDGRMIVNARKRPSRLKRRGREAAEKARKP